MIYICGRAFFEGKEEILFGAARIGGFSGGKAQRNRKGVIAAKVLPGAFLVILGILSHVRFLHVFVSECLAYC